jgi:Protein of unknown function (DUF2628)
MAVYTVHEPPPRAAAQLEPERFAFVRDGFSFWAFLLAPLWMLRHRMWLALLGYLVISFGLEALVRAFGASAFLVAVVGFLLSLLVGLEAGTLRRFTLSRRGWTNAGIVSGDDQEDAERRFFDTWVRGVASRETAPALAAPRTAPAVPMPHPQTPGIIGLFPEPGAQR